MDTVYGKPNPSSGLPIEVFDLTGTGGGTFAEAAPILGWDGTTLLWRRVAVDTKGQLIISNPGSGGSGGGGTASIIQVIGTDGTTTSVGYAATNTSVPVSFSGTNTVAGTVTTVPTGTQTIAGTAAVTQVTSPWVVSGTTTSIPSGTTTVVGTVTNVPSGTQSVAQTGSPWGVSGTVTAVESGTWSVSVVGTATTAPTGTQTVVVTGTVTDSIAGGTVTIIPSGTQSVNIVGTTTVIGTVTSIPSGTTTAVISGTATVSDATLPLYLDYSIQTNVRVYSNEMIDRLDTIISLLQTPPINDNGYSDTRTIGIVGPRALTDGAHAWRRHDNTGCIVNTPGHAPYQESVLRGQVYTVSNPGAQSCAIGSATVSGLIMCNPVNSGKQFVILDVTAEPTAAFGLSTASDAAVSLGYSLSAITGATNTGISILNNMIGAPAATVALCYSLATFSAIPTIFRNIFQIITVTNSQTGTGTTIGGAGYGLVFPTRFPIDGIVIVPPGVSICMGPNGAVNLIESITWEEIPI